MGFCLFAHPLLVKLLLGPGFDQSVPVLRLMAVLPPFIAASNLLGIQWMLPLRMDHEFNGIILAAGALNLVLAFVLARPFQQTGMALSMIAAEAFVTAAMLAVLRYRRLDPWSALPEQSEAAA